MRDDQGNKNPLLRVTEVPHEVLRYYVTSETDLHTSHMVDLRGFGGNGSCSCTDFTTRRIPRLKEIGRIEEYQRGFPSTRCKHIDAAVRHFANTTLIAIAQDNPLDAL
jgi:TnpA family transposase